MRRSLLLTPFVVLVTSSAAIAAPVITEVAWMGSLDDFADEYVEIYNPGPSEVGDLSQYVLVEGTSQRALPAVALAVGAVLVLESDAASTSLAPPAAEVITLSLSNSGEALRLCPVGAENDLAQCDVANAAGGWPAGDNDSKQTMLRKDASLDGSLDSSWVTHGGPDSAVTGSAGAPIKGTPGAYTAVVSDAGPDPIDAGPLPPPPAITEVAWMGSVSDSGDEWVELYNDGPDDITDLSRYVLVEGGTPRALPAVPLAAGGVVVLEANAAATSLGPPEAEVISLSLSNSGEALRVCPAGAETALEECSLASAGGAWPAGSNTSKRTMVRVDVALDGSQPSSWLTHDGDTSPVGDSLGVGILGSPGSYAPTVVEPQPDGGVPIEDGGVIVPPDAGPNAAPTLSLTEPSGEVRADGELTIRYQATDPDGDDTVNVSLFYDRDDGGHDGVEIIRGLPAAGTFVWLLNNDVPAGSYTVFGVATDDRGEVAYAYAPGRFVVEGGAAGGDAIIRVTDPDGVNDVVDGRITVRWEVSLPEGEDGTVSLFYDVDDADLDGEPLIAGLPVRRSDGEDGTRSFLWDPVDVPPGAYTIYAVLDWTGGTVSDYSEFVTVGGGGCACDSTGGAGGPTFAVLGFLVVALASARRRRHKGPSC